MQSAETTAPNRPNRFLIVTAIAALGITFFLAGSLWSDQKQEWRLAEKQALKAWQTAGTCIGQRNALLRLSTRMLLAHKQMDAQTRHRSLRAAKAQDQALSAEGFPAADMAGAERALERHTQSALYALEQIPRLQQLADLLAGAENRVLLSRLRYDREARRLIERRRTWHGRLLSRCINIPEPSLLGAEMPHA